MAEYLPGDIQRSQQYMELGRQSLDLDRQRLDLQKRQLEYSEKMQALQWAQFGLETVGKIWGIVDGIGNQKIMDMNAEYKNALLDAGQTALNSGEATVRIGEGGGLEYVGLDKVEAVKILNNDFHDRIKAEMGGLRIGDAGKAAKTLENTFMEINASTKATAYKMVMPRLLEQLEHNIGKGVDQAIVHDDFSLLKQTFAEAENGKWLPKDVLESRAQQAIEQVNKGRIENKALEIAAASSPAAGKAYLEKENVWKKNENPYFEITREQAEAAKASGREIPQQEIEGSKAKVADYDKWHGAYNPNFTQNEINNLYNKMRAASNNAADAAADKALKIFDETRKREGGATWAEARQEAMEAGWQSDNPDVWESVAKAVNGKLFTELHNEWAMKFTEARSEDFQKLKVELQDSAPNFQGNEVLYNKLMDEANSGIASYARKAKTGDEELDFLENRFGHEMAGAADYSVEELKALRKKYLVDRRDEYKNHGPALRKHVDYMDDIIEKKERAASGGAGGGKLTEAELKRQGELVYKDWQVGKINGDTAQEAIKRLGMNKDDEDKLLDMMWAGDDGKNTPAARAFARLRKITGRNYENLKDGKNDTLESLDYKERVSEIEKRLGMMRFNNKTEPKDMLAEVERIIEVEEAEMFDRASGALIKPGQFRAFSLGDYLNFANYELTDDNGRKSAEWIPGYEKMFEQYIKHEELNVKDSLKGTGWKMTESQYEDTRTVDNNGRVVFKLEHKDGRKATARVGMDGKLEKKEAAESTHVDGKLVSRAGGWVPFESAIASGRLGTAKGVAEKLSETQKTQIDDAIEKAERQIRVSRSPQTLLSALEIDIGKIIGNIAETDNGKEYIKKVTERLREKYSLNWTGR